MLDHIRKKLLNLTLNNGLLKLRDNSKTIKVENASYSEVVEKLVESNKKIIFIPEGVKRDARASSLYLYTNYTEKELSKRLASIFSESKSFIEERGINALCLSIGTLRWYESTSSSSVIEAPLLLVQVQLERDVKQGASQFELSCIENNIEVNQTLLRKLETDFRIKLPVFDDEDTVDQYFNKVKDAIKGEKRWEVVGSDIRLGLFSFLKIMMYHDLDDNNWPADKKPSKSFLIKNLFDQTSGSLIGESDKNFENGFSDKLRLEDIHHVLEADGSQADAIEKVFHNNYLVIKGPPGTGKSQTIANIIASCIIRGKSVLFVAEKQAALDVVKSRLDSAMLGDACLELHNHKANRKDVLNSIEQTLQKREHRELKAPNDELRKLNIAKEGLNMYYSALFQKLEPTQLRFYDIVLELLKYKSLSKDSIGTYRISQGSAQILEEGEKVLQRLISFVEECGQPSTFTFKRFGIYSITEVEKARQMAAIRELRSTIDDFRYSVEALAASLNVTVPSNIIEAKALLELAEILLQNNEQLSAHSIRELNNKKREVFGRFFQKLRQFKFSLEQHSDKFSAEAYRKQNFHDIKLVYERSGNVFKRLLPSFRKAKKELSTVLKTQPQGYLESLEWINVLVEQSEMFIDVERIYSDIRSSFRNPVDISLSGIGQLLVEESSILYGYRLLEYINTSPIGDEILSKVSIRHDNYDKLAITVRSVIEKIEDGFKRLQSDLDYVVDAKYSSWPSKTLFANLSIELQKLLDDFDQIETQIRWNLLKKDLAILNAPDIIELIKRGIDLNPTVIRSSWRYSVMLHIYDDMVKQYPVLKDTSLSDVAAAFRLSDRYLIEQHNKYRAKYAHLERVPPMDSINSSMTVLREQFRKKRQHLSIRKLIKQTKDVLLDIKPVIMMSPLSVAQYLEPGAIEFDYVIFDEASQVRSEDAIGALLRGKRAVVVGDEQQLPPTDFFNQVLETDDFEGDDEQPHSVDDMESILDLFLAKNARYTMLEWHYRSKHESLIAVSNKNFYHNKLINLPSAHINDPLLGLELKHYPDNVYKEQRNEGEAEKLVDVLIEHIKSYPNPDDVSIGVAAFSVKQKNCIEDIIMRRRRSVTELDIYMAKAEKAREPFFVKNLENVQGDERDIMFISICYGFNQDGKLLKRFGPVNNKGGERRLNVLFTRARQKCIIFSNFTSEDLGTTLEDKKGISVLKEFLNYAKDRNFTASESGREVDSPFEAHVKELLETKGYDVRCQIGSAGFFIDLAVVDPKKPGRYLLGIECDGAAYHSSRSARERDRLRQAVLEKLGWNIYRIWSTDWFKNPQKELNQLVAYIEQLKKKS